MYTIQSKRRPEIQGQCGPVQFYVYKNGQLVMVFKRKTSAEAFVAKCIEAQT